MELGQGGWAGHGGGLRTLARCGGAEVREVIRDGAGHGGGKEKGEDIE